MTQVILSDGDPLEVPTLPLYALDAVPLPDLSPYTVTIQVLTPDGYQAREQEYDIDQWEEPPEKPPVPRDEVKERSEAWYAWREYDNYQGGLEHRRKQHRDFYRWAEDALQYVLEQLSEEALARIVTEEDWQTVYTAMLVPPLTEAHIRHALKTYRASYNDEDILNVMQESGGGRAKVDAVRYWEGKARVDMQLREVEWAALSIEERARTTVLANYDRWVEGLEVQRIREEASGGKMETG